MSRFILILPCEEYIEEIRTYRQEFLDANGHFSGDSNLSKFEDISAWIEQCQLSADRETLPNSDWVEADQFMLVTEGQKRILGMIHFRHYLNEYLAEYGGHIGYGIRPSERKKGYAKMMLNLCLEKCRERKLNSVLITCNEGNEASRRTILACGGVYDRSTAEGNRTLKRYWIPLMPAHRTPFVYGTGNPAKLQSMRGYLAPLGIRVIGPEEAGAFVPDVEESGNSPAENAKIKATAYYKALQKPVFACDSGLYIDGLPDQEQPGVHVRRVGGKLLNDAEMTAHYAAVADKLGGRPAARYKNAICLIISETEMYEHSDDDISGDLFYLVNKPHPKRTEGFPLDSISIHADSGEYYYDWQQPNGVDGTTKTGFQNFFRRVLNLNKEDITR